LGDLVIEAELHYTPEALRQRTKDFAIRIVRLARWLPKSGEGRLLAGQILRSGTSVAANYRAACRARSRAEFVAKLGIAVEEADETVFWLGLLAILSASRKTAKLSITKSPNRQITK
jgi:four helix bundle protein